MSMRFLFPAALLLSCSAHSSPAAQAASSDQKPQAKAAKATDRSGKPRKGKASYYGHGFVGKKMADGTPMNPHARTAASRTLPLGTRARVTNLRNGKSTVVEIRDRGPYVPGRIIDVTPKVASELDLEKHGVVPVEVQPLALPPTDSRRAAADVTAPAESVSQAQAEP